MPGKPPVLLLDHGGRRVGLLVDEVLGERELVIKPLGLALSRLRVVIGAVQQADGSLILVLHAGELVRMAVSSQGLAAGPKPASASRRRILLVEDSVITRELERSLLVSVGVEVVEAVDGQDGLEKLAAGNFDLVVADVEMPRLDGFELTRRIKQGAAGSRIPVILVTNRGSDADRRRGIEVGADAYLVKSEFGSQSFLDTVRRFLD
jgi:CheY-like chemotaxis protein